MSNQEAIEILKIERDHMAPTLLPERIEAVNMAISALEEQIPEKPEYSSDGYADGNPVWDAYCPVCGKELDGEAICPKCGQRILWEDVE